MSRSSPSPFDAPQVDPSMFDVPQTGLGRAFLDLARRVQAEVEGLCAEAGGWTAHGGLVAQIVQVSSEPISIRPEPMHWRVLGADGEPLGAVELDFEGGRLVVRSPFREAAERGLLP